jgi:ADP-ribose pyrophosphatase
MSIEVVHSNPWFTVSLARDGEQDWYRVNRPDSAMVIGRTHDGQFLFLHGTRDTTGAECFYEFPSGAVEEGEAPSEAAARETMEETGYATSNLSAAGLSVEAPGIRSSVCHVFTADVVQTGEPQLESGECWKTVLVSASDVPGLVSSGQIVDAGTLGALALHNATGL